MPERGPLGGAVGQRREALGQLQALHHVLLLRVLERRRFAAFAAAPSLPAASAAAEEVRAPVIRAAAIAAAAAAQGETGAGLAPVPRAEGGLDDDGGRARGEDEGSQRGVGVAVVDADDDDGDPLGVGFARFAAAAAAAPRLGKEQGARWRQLGDGRGGVGRGIGAAR